MLVWCMKCQKKQSIKDKYFTKTKHNKYLVKGICPICQGRMASLITKDHYESEKK